MLDPCLSIGVGEIVVGTSGPDFKLPVKDKDGFLMMTGIVLKHRQPQM